METINLVLRHDSNQRTILTDVPWSAVVQVESFIMNVLRGWVETTTRGTDFPDVMEVISLKDYFHKQREMAIAYGKLWQNMTLEAALNFLRLENGTMAEIEQAKQHMADAPTHFQEVVDDIDRLTAEIGVPVAPTVMVLVSDMNGGYSRYREVPADKLDVVREFYNERDMFVSMAFSIVENFDSEPCSLEESLTEMIRCAREKLDQWTNLSDDELVRKVYGDLPWLTGLEPWAVVRKNREANKREAQSTLDELEPFFEAVFGHKCP